MARKSLDTIKTGEFISRNDGQFVQKFAMVAIEFINLDLINERRLVVSETYLPNPELRSSDHKHINFHLAVSFRCSSLGKSHCDAQPPETWNSFLRIQIVTRGWFSFVKLEDFFLVNVKKAPAVHPGAFSF